MKKTVVILLSDKRSGSTMLERELCKHSQIRHIDYCPHSYNETHHWLKSAVVLRMPSVLFSGGEFYPGYGSPRNALSYLIDGVQGNVPDFSSPKDAKELIFKGWDALCEKYAQPVFFEKSPQHLAHWAALSLMLEWARQSEYDVKFIGLVRNPLGVMYSAQRLFGTNPEQRQYEWLEIQKNLLAFRQLIKPEQYHEVRYEYLTNNPQAEFAKLCEYIGIKYEQEIGANVHGNSLKKAINDPAFGLQLADPVVQMAMHFGYGEQELVNATFDEKLMKRHVGPKWGRKKIENFKNRVFKPMKLRLKNARDGGN